MCHTDMWAFDTTRLNVDAETLTVQWTRLGDLPKEIVNSAAVTIHGRAHVIGGGRDCNLHMVYTPGKRGLERDWERAPAVAFSSAVGTWECLPSTPVPAPVPVALLYEGSRRVGILGYANNTGPVLHVYDSVDGGWIGYDSISWSSVTEGAGCMLDEDTALVHGKTGTRVLTGLFHILGDSVNVLERCGHQTNLTARDRRWNSLTSLASLSLYVCLRMCCSDMGVDVWYTLQRLSLHSVHNLRIYIGERDPLSTNKPSRATPEHVEHPLLSLSLPILSVSFWRCIGSLIFGALPLRITGPASPSLSLSGMCLEVNALGWMQLLRDRVREKTEGGETDAEPPKAKGYISRMVTRFCVARVPAAIAMLCRLSVHVTDTSLSVTLPHTGDVSVYGTPIDDPCPHCMSLSLSIDSLSLNASAATDLEREREGEGGAGRYLADTCGVRVAVRNLAVSASLYHAVERCPPLYPPRDPHHSRHPVTDDHSLSIHPLGTALTFCLPSASLFVCNMPLLGMSHYAAQAVPVVQSLVHGLPVMSLSLHQTSLSLSGPHPHGCDPVPLLLPYVGIESALVSGGVPEDLVGPASLCKPGVCLALSVTDTDTPCTLDEAAYTSHSTPHPPPCDAPVLVLSTGLLGSVASTVRAMSILMGAEDSAETGGEGESGSVTVAEGPPAESVSLPPLPSLVPSFAIGLSLSLSAMSMVLVSDECVYPRICCVEGYVPRNMAVDKHMSSVVYRHKGAPCLDTYGTAYLTHRIQTLEAVSSVAAVSPLTMATPVPPSAYSTHHKYLESDRFYRKYFGLGRQRARRVHGARVADLFLELPQPVRPYVLHENEPYPTRDPYSGARVACLKDLDRVRMWRSMCIAYEPRTQAIGPTALCIGAAGVCMEVVYQIPQSGTETTCCSRHQRQTYRCRVHSHTDSFALCVDETPGSAYARVALMTTVPCMGVTSHPPPLEETQCQVSLMQCDIDMRLIPTGAGEGAEGDGESESMDGVDVEVDTEAEDTSVPEDAEIEASESIADTLEEGVSREREAERESEEVSDDSESDGPVDDAPHEPFSPESSPPALLSVSLGGCELYAGWAIAAELAEVVSEAAHALSLPMREGPPSVGLDLPANRTRPEQPFHLYNPISLVSPYVRLGIEVRHMKICASLHRDCFPCLYGPMVVISSEACSQVLGARDLSLPSLFPSALHANPALWPRVQRHRAIVAPRQQSRYIHVPIPVNCPVDGVIVAPLGFMLLCCGPSVLSQDRLMSDSVRGRHILTPFKQSSIETGVRRGDRITVHHLCPDSIRELSTVRGSGKADVAIASFSCHVSIPKDARDVPLEESAAPGGVELPDLCTREMRAPWTRVAPQAYPGDPTEYGLDPELDYGDKSFDQHPSVHIYIPVYGTQARGSEGRIIFHHPVGFHFGDYLDACIQGGKVGAPLVKRVLLNPYRHGAPPNPPTDWISGIRLTVTHAAHVMECMLSSTGRKRAEIAPVLSFVSCLAVYMLHQLEHADKKEREREERRQAARERQQQRGAANLVSLPTVSPVPSTASTASSISDTFRRDPQSHACRDYAVAGVVRTVTASILGTDPEMKPLSDAVMLEVIKFTLASSQALYSWDILDRHPKTGEAVDEAVSRLWVHCMRERGKQAPVGRVINPVPLAQTTVTGVFPLSFCLSIDSRPEHVIYREMLRRDPQQCIHPKPKVAMYQAQDWWHLPLGDTPALYESDGSPALTPSVEGGTPAQDPGPSPCTIPPEYPDLSEPDYPKEVTLDDVICVLMRVSVPGTAEISCDSIASSAGCSVGISIKNVSSYMDLILSEGLCPPMSRPSNETDAASRVDTYR
ncbi:hypothetical protein KIPB_001290 [Kipferlia bialata]|uniref:Uncharacterized protein n=1 Tax=Kipferlia bialata TaxID=797122 RepID=A0A9K3CQH0_9EUKA|nr:hypothetical protein KIPB_001290 [Kipferlia bialata]|eukprot:g1290.t1